MNQTILKYLSFYNIDCKIIIYRQSIKDSPLTVITNETFIAQKFGKYNCIQYKDSTQKCK